MKYRRPIARQRPRQGVVEHLDRLPDREGSPASIAEKAPRGRRRLSPLASVFETEMVPMLKADPGLRPVGIFEEMFRRHAELRAGTRRTLERRIRAEIERVWPIRPHRRFTKSDPRSDSRSASC